ncbi:TPA: hypothetical protein N0F65_009229 [Lagenidium giganteum]|uniref:Secreted protein n=1 Tax=Lagenidium giganteum TaxID=4803 RepID=A0AAV2YTD0_9STRA|nr:TPA: hypothetical protein N0F65_009229 [Lagenidium giganteum]
MPRCCQIRRVAGTSLVGARMLALSNPMVRSSCSVSTIATSRTARRSEAISSIGMIVRGSDWCGGSILVLRRLSSRPHAWGWAATSPSF